MNKRMQTTGRGRWRMLAALALALALITAACGGATETGAGGTAAPGEGGDAATADEATGTTDGADAGDGFAEPVAERMTVEELEAEFGPVPEPSGEYRVGAIEKTLINEHWQQMQSGYQDAGADYGVEVVVQAAQDESDLTGQLAIAENMLGQGFDVFAVSPLSSSNLDPFLQAAGEQGIPIINVDDARVDARVFVGSDHREMGVLAAQKIAEMIPDGGKVAQIEGQAGSPAAQQRIDGFTSEIEQHSQFELVASVPADWDRQQALDVMNNLLQSHPDLKAVYANNDTMALGAVEAVRNAGKIGEVLIFGTDGVPDAIKAIEEGAMTGTVASFPYDMGYTAVEVAIRLLEGQGVPSWVVSRMEMVTQENLDEVQ